MADAVGGGGGVASVNWITSRSTVRTLGGVLQTGVLSWNYTRPSGAARRVENLLIDGSVRLVAILAELAVIAGDVHESVPKLGEQVLRGFVPALR